jgi:hypothetical protein
MRDFRTGKNAFLSPLSPLSRPSSYFRDPHESAKSLLIDGKDLPGLRFLSEK